MTVNQILDYSPREVEISTQHPIYSVLFAHDGKQVLSGDGEGMLRRWQVEQGSEVGEPIKVENAEIYAAELSPDNKWLVCGLHAPDSGSEMARVGVWDAQTHQKVLDIKGHTSSVWSVNISSDSTKFATGGLDNQAFIWSIATGERLVGPLRHDGLVVAVGFSPSGDHIATATAENPDPKSIRIYDSENGQLLLDIPFQASKNTSASLAWSADGRQLFAVSYGEVKHFDISSGSLLNKWSVPGGTWAASLILSRNEKFMVIVASNSLSFWDTSTQQQIGTAIEHASLVWSIALSPDDECIATGEDDGKVTLRGLRNILPDSYLTAQVSSSIY